jgi:hypothetical protein
MIDHNKNKVPVVVDDIIEVEKKRAQRFMADALFGKRVNEIRQKYIVDGFLMPLYAHDGRYARFRRRVNQFGNYIVPEEKQGTAFFEGGQGRLINELMWFWIYLREGQEVISPDIELVKQYRINGIPSNLVWPEIVALLKELHLYGEAGGGMVIPANDIDSDNLSRSAKLAGSQEDEDGYLEDYRSSDAPNTPGWMMLFDAYDSHRRSRNDFEVRPAWFHLVKYIFFNTPMRLPVFTVLITTEGKLKELKFLEEDLTDQARNFIGKELLNMPIRFKKMIEGAHRRGRDEMIWWLWHNVGHPEKRTTLTYRTIADIAGTSRSSIQTAVERFDKIIKTKMEAQLLGRLLRIAGSLGIGANQTYHALFKKRLVPARKRDIDGFDDLDKLI